MKIDVNELKSKNQNHFTMSKVIEELEDVDFKLLESVKLDFSIDFLADEVHLKGTFKTKVEVNCVRCLNPYELSLEGEIEGYYLDKKAFAKYANEQEDEVESDKIAYEAIIDDEIDLGQLVREHLILEINPYGLCSEECIGLEELEKYSDDGVDPRWIELLEMSKKIN